jgi:hypothetical protein
LSGCHPNQYQREKNLVNSFLVNCIRAFAPILFSRLGFAAHANIALWLIVIFPIIHGIFIPVIDLLL